MDGTSDKFSDETMIRLSLKILLGKGPILLHVAGAVHWLALCLTVTLLH